MRISDENARELAEKIVNTIKDHTAPRNCTWGDNYPEAHGELFGFYHPDLVDDIRNILRES